VVIENGIAD